MELFYPPEVFDGDAMLPFWLIAALITFVFLMPLLMSMVIRKRY